MSLTQQQMIVRFGICDFCLNVGVRVISTDYEDEESEESASICFSCVSLAEQNAKLVQPGILKCQKCSNTNEFIVHYSNGVQIQFTRAGLDARGYVIYVPLNITGRWSLRDAKKAVVCATCKKDMPRILWKVCRYI